MLEDPVVRFLLGGATGPGGGGIIAFTSAVYTAVDPDANWCVSGKMDPFLRLVDAGLCDF